MSDIKFTPGPWLLDDRTTSALAVNDTDGMIFINAHGPVARLSAMHYGISETRANAKLIAAAPDMFEIIKELYDFAQSTQTFGPIYPKIEAAYLKATE